MLEMVVHELGSTLGTMNAVHKAAKLNVLNIGWNDAGGRAAVEVLRVMHRMVV